LPSDRCARDGAVAPAPHISATRIMAEAIPNDSPGMVVLVSA
jgi:hypothetical protein